MPRSNLPEVLAAVTGSGSGPHPTLKTAPLDVADLLDLIDLAACESFYEVFKLVTAVLESEFSLTEDLLLYASELALIAGPRSPTKPLVDALLERDLPTSVQLVLTGPRFSEHHGDLVMCSDLSRAAAHALLDSEAVFGLLLTHSVLDGDDEVVRLRLTPSRVSSYMRWPFASPAGILTCFELNADEAAMGFLGASEYDLDLINSITDVLGPYSSGWIDSFARRVSERTNAHMHPAFLAHYAPGFLSQVALGEGLDLTTLTTFASSWEGTREELFAAVRAFAPAA